MTETQVEYVDRGPKEITGKVDWSVFPFAEAEEVCIVFANGAKKYGAPFTYRKGIPESELLAAAVRHLVQIHRGQSIDQESGCSHWAHVAANAIMAIAQYQRMGNSKKGD